VRTLYGLHYSPWTERACWALDHHLLDFRYREHLALMGNPWLRLRARKLLGRVSVPYFEDGAGARIFGSIGIARFAERVGTGSRLFPQGLEAEIERVAAECDAVMEVARARVIARLRADDEALRQALPDLFPDAVARALRPVTRATAARVAAEYKSPPATDEAVEREVAPRLEAFRKRLGGREHLLGDQLTFADIALATTLQSVRPVDRAFWPMKEGTARVWTEPALVERFADLLAWRDGIYARARQLPPR
jgi:glutathione S-transferase